MSRLFKQIATGVALIAVFGCSSAPKPLPADRNNIVVVAADGSSLKDAVITAATSRRWTTSAISENVIRCSIFQRSNKVEVDIVIHDRVTYSIRCVSSNISEAKYLQWINNLQREIAKAVR